VNTLRATEPLRIDGVVVIPVQRVRIEPAHGCGCVCMRACAEPRAIVVDEGTGWRAFDLDGAELPLAPLLEAVAGLAEHVTDKA
jgi:hypothetical protein